MKKLILILLLSLFSNDGLAQSYNLKSLYSQEALVTGRFLPFKVYENGTPVKIYQVHVYGPCDTLIDNNRPEIFHIYCVKQDSVDLIIKLQNGVMISANDINIKKMSIIDPDIDLPSGDSLGKRLFTDNCLECHRTQRIGGVQTAASVRKALITSPMKERGLGTLLNGDDEKIEALVKYINGDR